MGWRPFISKRRRLHNRMLALSWSGSYVFESSKALQIDLESVLALTREGWILQSTRNPLKFRVLDETQRRRRLAKIEKLAKTLDFLVKTG